MSASALTFAKHLPPSAEAPRVLALDAAAAADVAAAARVTLASELLAAPPGPYDAVVGRAAPEELERLAALLRPGGRVILVHAAEPQTLLAALTAAGYIHCLVEPLGDLTLYRGERRPEGTSLDRLHSLAESPISHPQLPITNYQLPPSQFAPKYLYVLIFQYPNKPVWKLAPGEKVEWSAATVLDPTTGQPQLLAFSSLVKATAFMQSAILAGTISGVNKIAKFPAGAASTWAMAVLLNPPFDAVRSIPLGPPLRLDPQSAITGDE